MITIQTSTSRIKNNDGSLATGSIIIRPSSDFNFTESGAIIKITTEPIRQTFTSGILDSSFSIAPTLNASQDKSNLYYTVSFYTNSGNWTEYWVLDGAGSATLEITSVTKVIVNPVASTVDYVPSGDVSVASSADGIPRAGATGIIDSGWLVASGQTLVYAFTPYASPPAGVSLAIGYDADSDQVVVYAGGRWRVAAG